MQASLRPPPSGVKLHNTEIIGALLCPPKQSKSLHKGVLGTMCTSSTELPPSKRQRPPAPAPPHMPPTLGEWPVGPVPLNLGMPQDPQPHHSSMDRRPYPPAPAWSRSRMTASPNRRPPQQSRRSPPRWLHEERHDRHSGRSPPPRSGRSPPRSGRSPPPRRDRSPPPRSNRRGSAPDRRAPSPRRTSPPPQRHTRIESATIRGAPGGRQGRFQVRVDSPAQP